MDYEKNRIITQEELNKMGEELSNYAESLINRQFKKISNDMNYEQKYNKALERARKLKENPQGVFYEYSPDEGDTICDYIFPELKESEDEKTKRILYSISSKISFHLHDIFTEEEFQCFDAWSNVWLEKQGTPNQVSIWKHWKDGIAGNGKGKLIYLIKKGNDYHLSSSLGYECDYIILSDLDELMLPKKQEYIHRDVLIDSITKYLYNNNKGFILTEKDIKDLKKYLENYESIQNDR